MTRPRGGFSLVELITAMLLVAIGLVAVASAALLAQRTLTATAVLERITREASTLLDSLAAQPHPASGARETGGVLLSWVVEPDSAGARIRVQVDTRLGTRPLQLSFEGRHAPR
jgi:prepilin-type N-terminal cleavage/methylation domain-containing protein